MLCTAEELDEQILVLKVLACGCAERVPENLDPSTAICTNCRREKDIALLALHSEHPR